jgi:hypothetical protein
MREPTREELFAEFIRAQQMQGQPMDMLSAPVPEGMMTQSAPDNFGAAAQNFDAQRDQIQSQRDMAQQMALQAGKSPGLITAGNVSAAGASPMSALAQGLRGYQSGRQSRMADEGTAEVRAGEAAAAQAAGKLAQEKEDYARSRDTVADEQSRAKAAALLTQNQADNDYQGKVFKETLRQNAGEGEIVPYHDPSNPDNTINVEWRGSPKVAYYPNTNDRIDPETVRGMTPRKAGDTGSRAPKKFELEAAAEVGAADEAAAQTATSVTNVLRAPEGILYQGTGLNPGALAGKYNLPGSSDGPQVQDLQRNIKQLGFEGISRDLQSLDLKPVTEGEYEKVAEGNVGTLTDPYGIVSYVADTTIPIYRRQFQKAVDAGTKTQSEMDGFINNMEEDAIAGALTVNPDNGKITMPLSMLSRKGIDVQRVRDRLAAQAQDGSINEQDKALLIQILQAREQEK